MDGKRFATAGFVKVGVRHREEVSAGQEDVTGNPEDQKLVVIEALKGIIGMAGVFAAVVPHPVGVIRNVVHFHIGIVDARRVLVGGTEKGAAPI